MKKRFLAIVLAVILLPLSSCGRETGTTPKETTGIEAAPADWITIAQDYPYEPLANINPFKVPQIQADIPEHGQGLLEPASDGFVYLTMRSLTEDSGEAELKKPLARKFNRSGKLLWEKEYEFSSATGFVNNLVSLPDGFLYTLQAYPCYVEGVLKTEKSRIIRCDENGNVIWVWECDDFSGNMMKFAAVAENGEIMIIGSGRVKNGVQTSEDIPDNIVVTKLDASGSLLAQRWFGGSDFDHIYSAVYKKAAGIVVWGSSQSHDGDFAIDAELMHNNFVALMNEKLELQWVIHAGRDRGFDTAPLVTGNAEVYLLCSMHETGGTPKGLLTKLNAEGKVLWEKQIFNGSWGSSIEQAVNGDILIAKGYGDSGMLAAVDSDGNEKKLVEGLRFYPRQLYPVASGGFIVTATRNIGYLPQPPYISSIWYDTELVVTKYNSDYEIEWRKTYDRYPKQLGTDEAWPQADGSIVVPG